MEAPLPVDVSKKLRVVRNVGNTLSKLFSNEEVLASDTIRQTARRKINIPICDVLKDDEYDKIIKPTFHLSTSYVRHVRHIGDEADITIDYNIERADRLWLQASKFAMDKEMKCLTLDAFETILNILERHTGSSRVPTPELHADRFVAETLKWTPTLTARLLPEVYAYWLKKRELLRKPLCRKFWPQTPAADNNPHLTFRPRDKERYRLRKQQRKNDIETFRKMQQLEREFSRANMLLELLVDREQLKIADLAAKQEIFLQTIYDLAPPTTDQPYRRIPQSSCNYTLQYESHLHRPHEDTVQAESGEIDKAGAARLLKASVLATKQQADAETKRFKRQSSSAMRKKRDDLSMYGVVDRSVSIAAGESAFVPSHEAIFDVHPNVPGPSIICRQSWQPFFFPLATRDQVSGVKTTRDYLDELELAENENSLNTLRATSCRTRLGRGGIVIDRIPLFSQPASAIEDKSAVVAPAWSDSSSGSGSGTGRGEWSYMYPTDLQSRLLKIGPTATPVSLKDFPSESTSTNRGVPGFTDGIKSVHRKFAILPPTIPPEDTHASESLLNKCDRIYDFSDSEDESLHVEELSNRVDADSSNSNSKSSNNSNSRDRPYVHLEF